MTENIYIDKIRLGAVLVEKEFRIVNLYNIIINNIRTGAYEKIQIKDMIEYNLCWANIGELYNLLRFDTYFNVLSNEEQEEFKNIMERYYSFMAVGLEELSACVEYINILMSKNKFHDVLRESDDDDF